MLSRNLLLALFLFLPDITIQKHTEIRLKKMKRDSFSCGWKPQRTMTCDMRLGINGTFWETEDYYYSRKTAKVISKRYEEIVACCKEEGSDNAATWGYKKSTVKKRDCKDALKPFVPKCNTKRWYYDQKLDKCLETKICQKDPASFKTEEHCLHCVEKIKDSNPINMTMTEEVAIPEEQEQKVEPRGMPVEDKEEWDRIENLFTPKSEAPKSVAPKSEGPKTESPKSEAPKSETPRSLAPKAEAPKSEAQKLETPKSEAQKLETPKSEAPKSEGPKSEGPKSEAQKLETPESEVD